MIKRSAVIAVLVALVLAAGAGPATAHPLGNFSVNLYSGIEVSTDAIAIQHIVDMAEIPAFQEMRVIDDDGDGAASPAELEAYADARASAILEEIDLRIDDETVTPTVLAADASLLDGRGGLETLRVETRLTAPLEDPRVSIAYNDHNFADRIGWREIVARAVGRQGLASSTVAAMSATDALRSYPRTRLTSPEDVTSAFLESRPGASPAAPESRARRHAAPGDLLSSAFASLIEHDLSLSFVLFALGVSLLAGALHALGPGHGKSVMAAYLVGSGGRMRHAVAVGAAVSLMHTASVIVLGLVTLWASRSFPEERLYPYLSLVSGAVVLSLGLGLLWARTGARGDGHGDHHHHHAEDHHHRHGHAHAASDAGPLSWKGLGLLGVSGGLLPSPAALVVLLGSIALGRTGFGLTLVAAFSVGLAGALTLMGLLVLRARSFTRARLGGRAAALLPVVSAAAVSALGAVLTTRALIGL